MFHMHTDIFFLFCFCIKLSTLFMRWFFFSSFFARFTWQLFLCHHRNMHRHTHISICVRMFYRALWIKRKIMEKRIVTLPLFYTVQMCLYEWLNFSFSFFLSLHWKCLQILNCSFVKCVSFEKRAKLRKKCNS